MTEAARILPEIIPAAALSAADLALLHADLPQVGPRLVEVEELDAEALTLDEWGPDAPMFPRRLLPERR
ncbi:hypothetical protein [Deinococcus yunweiensis]|uniref:hypothetical protein n=1 Tax=Deinococcus yunweiensis TaxID=367282 RepID=UPI00398E72E2